MDANTLIADYRDRIANAPCTLRDLASGTEGINYSWLVKFAGGIMDNPTVKKIEALDKALRRFDA